MTRKQLQTLRRMWTGATGTRGLGRAVEAGLAEFRRRMAEHAAAQRAKAEQDRDALYRRIDAIFRQGTRASQSRTK